MLASSLGKLPADPLHPASDLNSSSSPLQPQPLWLSSPISGQAFPHAPSRSSLAGILPPPAQNFSVLSNLGSPAYLPARSSLLPSLGAPAGVTGAV